MSHPRTRSMFASSKASVTGSPADILDAMLANQAAAARAVRDTAEWAEAQARAEWHAEEFDWERALGREEGDE